MYTDDQTAGKRMLEVWPVCSPHARAKILKRDAAAARAMPGIRAVLLAEDIPGLLRDPRESPATSALKRYFFEGSAS